MKPTAQRPATMAEMKDRLLKAGKITEQGLTKARKELDADPEILAARKGLTAHVLG
jgi:hypothetical protein